MIGGFTPVYRELHLHVGGASFNTCIKCLSESYACMCVALASNPVISIEEAEIFLMKKMIACN